MSTTVTVNVVLAEFGVGLVSLAEHVTVVTAMGNRPPVAVLQVTGLLPATVSNAVGVV